MKMTCAKNDKNTIKAERVFTVKKTGFNLSMEKIYGLLKEAESVTEGSEAWEVKAAFSKYYEALGAISIMVTLGILLPVEHTFFSIKQKIIGEKLTRLSEKRTLDTANI